MMILTRDKSPILDAERVQSIAEKLFGTGTSTLYQQSSDSIQYTVAIDPKEGTPFSIRQLGEGHISTDGTESQDNRFAAALRSALPSNFNRIVAVNIPSNTYVDLIPGITPEQIRSGWRPVDEGGFE
ncbi:hypothetical protein AB0O87_05115 [Microbacterium sp. NPDC076768]|uniref:hypothetical protein n=1 Tax=Microbacterium sp. NPDC076768 TaxID=3154858 RepID=UPI00342CBAB2